MLIIEKKGGHFMEKQKLILGIVLNALNAFKLDNIEDRVLLQKKIYFTQRFGMDLSYSYNWYLKGPYSPGLTSVAFEVIPGEASWLSKYTLSTNACSIVGRVNSLNDSKPTELTDASWYELLASIDYLKNNSSWVHEKSKDCIRDRLRTEKPHYTDVQFEIAWDVLEASGLIKRQPVQ
jgi:uncharacterized protein YwgA